MRQIFFKALPYKKEDITLALESGVDGLIVPDDQVESAGALARCLILGESDVHFIALDSKADEQIAANLAKEAHSQGKAHTIILQQGWEIIPLENLLALAPDIAAEAGGMAEAVLACGTLERGVGTVVVTPQGLGEIKAIVAALKYQAPPLGLTTAKITSITPAGMGHRVCVDTTSRMDKGEGMLVGNSAAFTFLVNAETEHNEYVASRPFRVNAGSVHAYTLMPEDATAYLDELGAGSVALAVSHTGAARTVTVGRVKVERRPMLLLEAELESTSAAAQGQAVKGSIFLQNAETICLVRPGGEPVSVTRLQAGDVVVCRTDIAGRHFGIRITEDIREE